MSSVAFRNAESVGKHSINGGGIKPVTTKVTSASVRVDIGGRGFNGFNPAKGLFFRLFERGGVNLEAGRFFEISDPGGPRATSDVVDNLRMIDDFRARESGIKGAIELAKLDKPPKELLPALTAMNGIETDKNILVKSVPLMVYLQIKFEVEPVSAIHDRFEVESAIGQGEAGHGLLARGIENLRSEDYATRQLGVMQFTSALNHTKTGVDNSTVVANILEKETDPVLAMQMITLFDRIGYTQDGLGGFVNNLLKRLSNENMPVLSEYEPTLKEALIKYGNRLLTWIPLNTTAAKSQPTQKIDFNSWCGALNVVFKKESDNRNFELSSALIGLAPLVENEKPSRVINHLNSMGQSIKTLLENEGVNVLYSPGGKPIFYVEGKKYDGELSPKMKLLNELDDIVNVTGGMALKGSWTLVSIHEWHS